MYRKPIDSRIGEALLAAQNALNTIPNTRLNGKYRNSYEVAAVVDAAVVIDKQMGQSDTEVCVVDQDVSLVVMACFSELLEICRSMCSPNDEIILQNGRTNHAALVDATAVLQALHRTTTGTICTYYLDGSWAADAASMVKVSRQPKNIQIHSNWEEALAAWLGNKAAFDGKPYGESILGSPDDAELRWIEDDQGGSVAATGWIRAALDDNGVGSNGADAEVVRDVVISTVCEVVKI